MFDTLVESSKHGQENTKTGIYMLVTGSIYAVALLVIGVATILYMDPRLADAFDVAAMIAPPPPPSAPPPPAPAAVIKNIPVTPTFVPPTKPPEKIPDPTTASPNRSSPFRMAFRGACRVAWLEVGRVEALRWGGG